jgi:hypothetical protein
MQLGNQHDHAAQVGQLRAVAFDDCSRGPRHELVRGAWDAIEAWLGGHAS